MIIKTLFDIYNLIVQICLDLYLITIVFLASSPEDWGYDQKFCPKECLCDLSSTIVWSSCCQVGASGQSMVPAGRLCTDQAFGGCI